MILAAYKATEKSNDTHIVFSGELSPYSNFHHSPFIINGQQFHSSKQWVQYQKALMFGDSFTANQILQSETPLECKKLGYNINGVDKEKWTNIGYEICFDGIREKFLQNPPLLSMLKTTTPKILAEATEDRLWGTGIKLCDNVPLIQRNGQALDGYPECYILLEVNKLSRIKYTVIQLYQHNSTYWHNDLTQIQQIHTYWHNMWYGRYLKIIKYTYWHNTSNIILPIGTTILVHELNKHVHIGTTYLMAGRYLLIGTTLSSRLHL